MKIDFSAQTLVSVREALDRGDLTSRELTEEYLAHAKKENVSTNAYAEIFDDAIAMAEHADQLIKEKKQHTLTGIPLAIKDNMLFEGKISASGSSMLKNYRAVYDSTVVKKLKAQGAVILGRANMDEFAMGSSSETCTYGPVKNPHDLTRVPGGTSGGSAVTVAQHIALGALGSDTGGSIRQPGALCGVVGMKPTYGAVSRYGLMAMASSLDQIGPFGKTVEDTRLIYEAIAGHDPLDSTSVPDNHVMRKTRDAKEKLTIGIPAKFISMEGVDDDVRQHFQETIDHLKSSGHHIVEIDLPHIQHALAVYYVIMPAEVSANLARYDGIRYGFSKEAQKLADVYRESRGEGFGKEVRRRILLGTYVLSAGYYDAYYNKAVTVRRMITSELKDVFRTIDLIATPTTTSPAFKLGEKTSDPLKMYLEDIFTVPANIAGIPGISVPMGKVLRDGKELPVGFQFLAPHFGEEVLFSGARLVEALWTKK